MDREEVKRQNAQVKAEIEHVRAEVAPPARFMDSALAASDPIVFASYLMAGMAAGGILHGDVDANLTYLKSKWHAARMFSEWVARGEDMDEYREMRERERLAREKAEAVEKADREAAAAQRRARELAYGAK